jgi:regulator of replication initiation timing
MEKHMKACRMFFELRKTIQKIDAEISGRHDDLKTMATEAKRLEMERKKEMERARGKGKKERGYIKEHAKSNLEQRMMREYSGRDSSYSDSSNSLDRLIPPKAPKSL